MIVSQKQFINIWSWLIFLYIISISLQTVFDFPIVGRKIQPPELIFLATTIFLLINFQKVPHKKIKFNSLDKVLLSYLSIVMITAFFAHNYHPFLEFIGLLYLFTNYFLLKTFLEKIEDKAYVFISKSIFWMGIIAASFGCLGITLPLFKIENSLGFIYHNYPYLGSIIRIDGLAGTPHMLASILNVSLLFLLVQMISSNKRKFTDWVALIFMLVVYFFTFAKIVVLLGVGILFILTISNVVNSLIKKISFLLSTCLIILYLVGTHFIFVHKDNQNLSSILNENFNSGEVVSNIFNYKVIPTAYTSLKKASLIIGKNNILTGVGAGNQFYQISELKENNLFPEQIPNFDPHSTFFGGFAELGIFGFITILILSVISFQVSKNVLNMYPIDPNVIALSACLLVFLFEAISADILNFRHLWVCFAFLSYLSANKTKEGKLFS